jgi:hypothetical protein
VFGQGVLGYLAPNHLLGLLNEIQRVLRPGGVSVFNFFTLDAPEHARRHLSSVLAQARRRRPHGGVDQAYTRAHLEALHRVAGLEPTSEPAAVEGQMPERIVIVATRPPPE